MARSTEFQMDKMKTPRVFRPEVLPSLLDLNRGGQGLAHLSIWIAIPMQGVIAAPLSPLQPLTGRLNKKIILKSGVRANSNRSASRREPLPFPASYSPVISTPFASRGGDMLP